MIIRLEEVKRELRKYGELIESGRRWDTAHVAKEELLRVCGSKWTSENRDDSRLVPLL